MSHQRLDRFVCDRCKKTTESYLNLNMDDEWPIVREPAGWRKTWVTGNEALACPACLVELNAAWSKTP